MARKALIQLAAAFALGCGVALMLAGGGGSGANAAGAPVRPSATARAGAPVRPSARAGAPVRPSATARAGATRGSSATAGSRATAGAPTGALAPPHRAPAVGQFAHTPAGAVAAATAWCQRTTAAFIDGGWEHAVSALTIGTFRAHALRYARAAGLVHRRLTAAGTPYDLRLWPLGYQVQQYSPAAARVRVWQLFVLAIAAPEANTQFTTTTVALQWADGDWKVTSAPPGPDLAPPPVAGATPGQVTTWVGAANQLESYAYVP